MDGVLTLTSVDVVTGEELPSGELVPPGGRGIPFRSARGACVEASHPELAARVTEQLRALDRAAGHPVRARFEITAGRETLAHSEPVVLPPLSLVRVLVERVRDGRMTRARAVTRLSPEQLDACGQTTITGERPAPHAHGLAASAGAAVGRLALPDDVVRATDGEPRVVVVDDASAEDAAALRAAVAIVATSGGLTADAAIAARALRKPCVVSTPLRLGGPDGPARGAWVTVDGSRGDVYLGALPTTWTPSSPHVSELLSWLDRADGESAVAALIRARKTAGSSSAE